MLQSSDTAYLGLDWSSIGGSLVPAISPLSFSQLLLFAAPIALPAQCPCCWDWALFQRWQQTPGHGVFSG